MSLMVLGMFCAGLILCILLDLSILYALAFGLVLFLFYGKSKGFGWRELFQTAMEGVLTIKNILMTFMLIGILTAMWRVAGTIPVIVCYASTLIRPSVFLLMTFLLNCGVSTLTGTSFGTTATMGVICATMGATLKVDPLFIGGAVLSGAYFGDRCSPVSTSALLVSELTETVIFDNIKRMAKTAVVPFLLTCGIYTVLGIFSSHAGEMLDLKAVFGREFQIHPIALLPALVILVLSTLRINVKIAMAASISTAIPIAFVLQKVEVGALLQSVLTGYHAEDTQVATMLNGGGITSMLHVAGIVCLSASYSGLFLKTGLLDGIKQRIERVAERTTAFAAMFVTAVFSGMVGCNQTLAVMLTDQLCRNLKKDASDFALDLEDSAVVFSPLVPWSIAGAVPLATVGAPLSALLLACYLYLLPLYRLAGTMIHRKQ